MRISSLGRMVLFGTGMLLLVTACAMDGPGGATIKKDDARTSVGVDPDSMATVSPPAPFLPVPSRRQLAWHKLKYYAFIHFGPNTFTDIEWGHGTESPDVFDPAQLDCRQWARVIRDAGMDGVIITAKHHDGFCLWPSKYSTHTVRESAWKDGKGDVLKELSQACREYGIRFGVYLSPWDRNHPAYGTDAYNEVFMNMLGEVLTQYGDIFEVWFDGACGEGPNGKRQVYDWPGFIVTVRKLQPMAVIFSDSGPDVRWIGNEAGYATETNWCTVRDGAFYPGVPGMTTEQQTGHEDGDVWLPAEADTSIRPGWFYHKAEDDKVKSVSELIDIWYHSVGMNANLILNLPVDSRGLIHENDVKALMGLRKYLDQSFSTNPAAGASATASDVRGGSETYGAENAIDDDPATYWAADDDIKRASIELTFSDPVEINALLIREYIALGQRVTSFSIDLWKGDGYIEAAKGTTVGNRRIVRFDTTRTKKLRINFQARACPCISQVEVYRLKEYNDVNDR